MRPLVILANDDGIHSPYLGPTVEALESVAGVEVMVVAPERERSASSHAITLHDPVRVIERGPGRFAVSGSPVDGVCIAILDLCPRPPALVVSGINRGYNLGGDVFYSGTVAAAAEGQMRGVPGVAASLGPRGHGDVTVAANFTATAVAALLADPLPAGILLNINVPAEADGRYRWTRLGIRTYHDVVHRRVDPRGRPYYWIAGSVSEVPNQVDSDCHAVDEGVISLTPMRYDITAFDVLDAPPGWGLDGYQKLK